LDLLDINSESYQSDINDFAENLNSLYSRSAVDTFGGKTLLAIIPARLLIDRGSISAVMKKEQHFITHVRLIKTSK
jgi:hypothetical protein